MKNTNLVDFGDILSSAEKLGVNWNLAHKILVNDDILPSPESSTRDFWISDFDASNPYGFKDETLKIMRFFCEENKLDFFTLVRN
jgi:hypothetical protein